MTVNRQLSADLHRFFAMAAFDAPRVAAIQRLEDGLADFEDHRVLRDRLDAYVRNGNSARRSVAKALLKRLGGGS